VKSAYPGGRYRVWNGTSMAAPFVTGTVALLAELHPAWDLTETMDQLSATSRTIAGDTRGYYGAGALDAGAALAGPPRSRIDVVPAAEEIRPARR
jgi:subtilisin family serine protease